MLSKCDLSIASIIKSTSGFFSLMVVGCFFKMNYIKMKKKIAGGIAE